MKATKSYKRRDQHAKRVKRKIKRFEKKSRNTAGLKTELAYCTSEKEPPAFKTGYAARAIGERQRTVHAPADQK